MKKILFWISFILILTSCWNETKRPNIDSPTSYYDELRQKCEKKDSKSCCLSSVETMEENNYKLANSDSNWNTFCEQWYNKNLLRCIDSYTRCESKINNF